MFHTNHMEDAAVMWIEVCFLWFHFTITSNFCILISYSNSEILNSNRFFHWKKNKHSRHFKLNSIYLHCQAVFQFIFRQCLFILHLKGGKIVSFETKTFEMNQKPFWIRWLEIIESKYQAIYRMISYLSSDKLFIIWWANFSVW